MKTRRFKGKDLGDLLLIYQAAFSGAPWFEFLSEDDVKTRWEIQSNKSGFECLVAEVEDRIVGATWWEKISLETIKTERGEVLAEFANKISQSSLIWIRETCVRPDCQNCGVASMLKEDCLKILRKENKPLLLLTRMRDDNYPIIVINLKLGFKRTGIKVRSSQCKEIFHEYWYKEI